MTNLSTVENKISTVEKNLEILKRYEDTTKEDIENNIDLRGALERYLFLTVQATIDLAGAFVSYRGFRKPSTFGESFQILKEKDILDESLADELVKMTGFRNILVHDYEDLDYEVVLNVLKNKTDQIREFVDLIKNNPSIKS